MKIITVSGTQSGVGKTPFIEKLLKGLKGWSCLKVTFAHKSANCPLNKNCGACDAIVSNYCIVSDEKTLMQKGKDTYRFKKAGAKKVLWLKAKNKAGLKQGINEALNRFGKSAGLIIEGTSVVKYLNPDLAVLIVKKGSPWKKSAREIFSLNDEIIRQ